MNAARTSACATPITARPAARAFLQEKELGHSVQVLVAVRNRDAAAMADLARHIENHIARLDRLRKALRLPNIRWDDLDLIGDRTNARFPW